MVVSASCGSRCSPGTRGPRDHEGTVDAEAPLSRRRPRLGAHLEQRHQHGGRLVDDGRGAVREAVASVAVQHVDEARAQGRGQARPVRARATSLGRAALERPAVVARSRREQHVRDEARVLVAAPYGQALGEPRARAASSAPGSTRTAISARPSSRSRPAAKRMADRSACARRRSDSARPISPIQRYCRTASSTSRRASTPSVNHRPRCLAHPAMWRV